jgi:hypothetical protein
VLKNNDFHAGEALGNLGRTVRRAVADDNDFDVIQPRGLLNMLARSKASRDGCADCLLLVQRRDDDGKRLM